MFPTIPVFPKSKKQRLLLAGSLAVCLMIVVVLIITDVKDKLALISPSSTALIFDRNGNFISESPLERQPGLGYWPITEEIPRRIRITMITTEDRRFYDHMGVDFKALARAIVHNFTHSTRQGASTIAMQVVRLQSQNRRTYWNKICEMLAAHWLVRKYGHEQILNHYLRIVPQGARYHGVSYAARRYFKKPLEDLSWAEAAVLSAIPKAPGKMNLYTWPGFVAAQKRARFILRSLHRYGRLTEDAFNTSMMQLYELRLPVKEYRPFHSYHAILEMEKRLRERRDQFAFNAPVLSSLDLSIQNRIDRLVYNSLEYYRYLGAGNAAFVVVERKTGHIVGYLGSVDYFNDQTSGKINYASVPRSTGSTLKPFIYAAGLESGDFSPTSILPDIPFHVKQPTGVFSINNYDDRFLGPILYRKALANSRNVPAVYLLQKIGLRKTFDYFDRMGLIKDDRKETYYGLGLAIGGLYVSLENLVSSYGILANDGNVLPLQWFKEDLPSHNKKIFSTTTARLTSLFLSDPQARLPSFSRMGPLEYSFPVAVKTGTSQGFRDAWTVAYSHKYIVGAWIGHPDNHRMKRVSGSCTADMVKKLMHFLHPDEMRGLNETPFPVPEGYRAARICSLTGEKDQPDCPETFIEYLPVEDKKETPKLLKQRYAVDSRTGTIANANTPAEAIEIRQYLELDPGFDEWKSSQDIFQSPYLKNHPLQTSIEIVEPVDESSFIIDPEIPLKLQTVALKANVTPSVSQIEWLVNGELYRSAAYPYVLRWPLQTGTYKFQARFTGADVKSETITISVSDN